VKLPSGRLDRSIPGGSWALRQVLVGLREKKFSGNVRTSLRKQRRMREGSLLLKEGELVLASHVSDAEVFGLEGLRLALSDSMDPASTIEVRSYSYRSSTVSVDHLLKVFPEARLGASLDPRNLMEVLAGGGGPALPAQSPPAEEEDGAAAAGPGSIRSKIALAGQKAAPPAAQDGGPPRREPAPSPEDGLRMQELRLSFEKERRRATELEERCSRTEKELEAIKKGSLAMLATATSPGQAGMVGEHEKRVEEWKALKNEEEIKNAREELEARKSDFDKERAALGRRESELDLQREELKRQQDAVQRERAELEAFWKKVMEESQGLNRGQTEMGEKLRELFEREKTVVGREEELARKEQELSAELDAFDAEKGSLVGRRKSWRGSRRTATGGRPSSTRPARR